LNDEEREALARLADVASQLTWPEADIVQQWLLRSAVPWAQPERRYPDVVMPVAVVNYRAKLQILQSLQSAQRRGRQLRVVYRSRRGQPREYVVDRSFQRWIDGALYLVGHCPGEAGDEPHERNREFRVDRITSVKALPTVCCAEDVPLFAFRFTLQPPVSLDYGRRFEHQRASGEERRFFALRSSPLVARQKGNDYFFAARAARPQRAIDVNTISL
jgi:hypothetical protein